MELFAVCTPGLEPALAAEVAALGATPRATAGGVEFEGDVFEANLRLRTATRVLVRVGRFKARDFARLRREVAALPWERFAAARPVVDVAATARRSRLYHTGGIAERIAGGVADRLSCQAEGGLLSIVARVEDDAFTISVDSSGEPIYKRGWRVETAKAPLRETLAAGLLALAEWDPTTPFVDPMCGSGTIVLEAAALAAGRAPGARRPFACETWPIAEADWAARRDLAAKCECVSTVPLVGVDRDAGGVEIARRNAARAGLAVTIVCADAAEAPLAERPGLILANPPYGQRIPARDVGRALAALRQRARGWRFGVLAPEPPPQLGRPLARHALTNGGVRVGLYLW
jgi:putative N6-adenine-specific DNA methylase